MRIKRLQLQGFKSCMEKTVLDFPPGITGVVGPNGCGKSNIVDALRWVLGEQSAKHLRGETMEDVIFAGNERYGPLGCAEVTITFDNDGNLAHSDASDPDDELSIADALRDAPEIEVTRRLYRSGESEYLMNGRSCRLRDITELFLGTGVGAKAYSVIEQGRVGEIVGAKPEELRLFVEEAAGTTLYRSRRLAAERKIDRTRNNLLRAHDIIGELERQAGSLKRQARGAERFRDLKVEEEALDKQLTAHRLRKVDAHRAEVGERLAAVLAESEELGRDMAAVTAERDQLRQKQQQGEKHTDSARRAYYDAKGKLTQMEQERRFLQSRIDELERFASEGKVELEQIDGRLSDAGREEMEVRNEQARLGLELERAAADRTREGELLEEIETKVSSLRAKLEEVKSETVEGLAKQASLENERSGIERSRQANAARKARLTEELRSLATLGDGLRSEVGKCVRRVDDLVDEIDSTAGGKESLAAKLSQTLGRKAESEREAQAQRQKVAGLASRYDSLRELSESFAGYGEGVKAFMSNGGKDRTGATAVVADVIEIEEGYERAVAALLQDRLEYVVVPSADEGMMGASYLRETETGRASFIPRSPRAVPLPGPTDPPSGFSLLSDHVRAREGYTEVIDNLLVGAVVADDLEQAAGQWKKNGSYTTFVTLEGEIIDVSGVVTGGSGRPHDEGILARKAELRGIEITLVDARDKVQEAVKAFEAVRAQATEAGEQLSQLDQRLHELTIEKVAAEGQVELQRQNLARTEERSRSVAGDIESLAEEESELLERHKAIESEREQVRETLAALEKEREELEARFESSEEGYRRKGAVLEQLKVREAELRQRREGSEMQLRSIRQSIADFSSRRDTMAERLEHDRREVEQSRARLDSPAMSVEHATEVLESAEKEFSSLEQESASLQRALSELESKLDGFASRLEEVREARSRHELVLKECELERENIAVAIRERTGLETDALLVEIAEEDISAEEEQARAERLDRVRNSIRRLGVVNVGAVTELEEIEGRLAELCTQRDDLEKSIEDLRGTIARLNRLSRQRFKETFEAVNEIFRETFPKLFHGGRAWLSLSDESNLLESGVEIYVQPPGKKVGNLNLLSGGEKALTAVSLIFSLFLHKPSPFCVLDEVDAPLDDANIGRFARMVSDMSSRSQFVLITHNKRTMERCDVLYGVTMREPGVSKIVSVEMGNPAG